MVNENRTTDEKPITKTKEAIIKEAKRIEEDCLYTSKGHFGASRFWSNFHLWIGIPTVILAGVVGTATISQICNGVLVVGVVSVILIVLSAVSTFLNPRERANLHLNAGNNYEALRNTVRIFWTIDCWRSDSDDLLTQQLKTYSQEKNRLNRECPQVPRFAYLTARKGIESGEAEHAVDRTD